MLFAGFIEHRGKKIVFLDIHGSRNVEESIHTGDQAKAIIFTQAPKSVLLLTDVSGTHYSQQGFDYMKQFSVDITPYVKASAMLGIDGVKRIVYRFMIKLSGRNIKLFDTVEAAKDWLAEQDYSWHEGNDHAV